ncbi:MAG: hypothetical protein ABF969_05660 [Sporolactobacillus sp.]
MTRKEEVEAIVAKYGHSYYRLKEEATRKEFKIAIKYVADDANRKQRKVAGLDG